MAKAKSKKGEASDADRRDPTLLSRRDCDTLATLIDNQRDEIFGVQATLEVVSEATNANSNYHTHRVTRDAARRLDEIAAALEMIMYQVQGSVNAEPIPSEPV